MNLTIRTRLSLSTGVTVAATALLALVSFSVTRQFSEALEEAVGATARKIELAQAVGRGVSKMQSSERATALAYADNDAKAAAARNAEFEQAHKSVLEQIAEMKQLLRSEEGRREAENLTQCLAAWLPLHHNFETLGAAGKVSEARQVLIAEVNPITNRLETSVSELVQQQRKFLAESSQMAADLTQSSRWMIVVLIAIAAGAAIAAFWVVNNVNRRLVMAVGQIRDGAEQIRSAASQVSASAQTLAQGASEQAATLEETSATAEEINAITRQNTDRSKQTAVLAGESKHCVKEAARSIEEMATAVKEMADANGKVAKVIRVIDEIAFQTNILALNAAVEAARAGSAGQGFAVVADEVRNLAQRCSVAAKETEQLIEVAIASSERGAQKVDLVHGAVASITDKANSVNTLADDVSSASGEQMRGIEQLASSVSQMQSVTQSTAATAEESAAAAEELNAQSDSLREVVRTMAAMIGGATAQAR